MIRGARVPQSQRNKREKRTPDTSERGTRERKKQIHKLENRWPADRYTSPRAIAPSVPTLDFRSKLSPLPGRCWAPRPRPRPLWPRPPVPRAWSPELSSQLRGDRPPPARPPCWGWVRMPLLAPGGRAEPEERRGGPGFLSCRGTEQQRHRQFRAGLG